MNKGAWESWSKTHTSILHKEGRSFWGYRWLWLEEGTVKFSLVISHFLGTKEEKISYQKISIFQTNNSLLNLFTARFPSAGMIKEMLLMLSPAYSAFLCELSCPIPTQKVSQNQNHVLLTRAVFSLQEIPREIKWESHSCVHRSWTGNQSLGVQIQDQHESWKRKGIFTARTLSLCCHL